jgi:RNA recognition motif. (a.k.a. RRM, RBD, or RNP domain)
MLDVTRPFAPGTRECDEEDTMKLWMGNIAPGTTDDELKAFVKKHAPQLECTGISRVPGDGSRPAAMLEFAQPPLGALEQVAQRLNGMYWKKRTLSCSTVLR